MHPTTEYAVSVVEGEVLTGKWVRWACQRHLDDLEKAEVYFDEQAANRIINFYKLVNHVKGEWAGWQVNRYIRKYKLEDIGKDKIYNLYYI